MKLITSFLFAFIMILGFTPAAFAEDTSSANLPQVLGEGAYLIDVQSGQTLFMKNPDKLLAPASTTKIMTGLLAIERGNLDDMVTASSTMLNNKVVYGTQIYLVPKETVVLRDLLYAVFLNSANDAAVAVAEHLGSNLPTFVNMMNQRALEIGATNTHFVNPSGLTETGHVTTAHDLALIARVAYQNPLFAQYVRTKSHTISRSKSDVPALMVNENKLLWRDSTVDGIKTGYTAAAQNCLVASMTKNDRQLIGVILKSPGREIYTDMQAMFDYGFTQYKDTVYIPSGSMLSTITVNSESVNLILDRPIYITQKINEPCPELNLHVVPTYIAALTSVKEGQVIANVEVLDGNTLLDTFPLKSTRSVSPPTPKKTILSYNPSWMNGVMIMLVASVLLISRKIYTDCRWRRQMRSTRRRESN